MLDSIKRLDELLDIEPHNKRIIVKTTLEVFDAIKTNEIKNIRRIAIEISMLEGQLNIKTIWNNLDEFEMNELVAKLNAEIDILEKRDKQKRKYIKNIEELKLELREMEAIKTKFIS